MPEAVNILLVDDNPRNLTALAAILERPDYKLLTATSGEEALHLLLREDFAVLLLDVFMPGMDGFEVASIIKGREKTRGIPIIFVTAVAHELKDIYRGYSVGAVDYIQKPLDPDVVRAKVAVFVDLYRAKEQVRAQAEIIRQSERADSLEREHAARMQAELAERRYYDLINWVDHAVLWEYDAAKQRFAFVSKHSTEILGYTPEEWLADPRFLITHAHPDDRGELEALLAEGVRDGKDGRCEHRFYNAAGQLVWLHTGVNPRHDVAGKVDLLWGLSLDISGAKRAAETQRFLSRATALLSESLDYEKNLARLSHLVVPALADLCAVDVLDGGHALSRVVFTVAPGMEDVARALEGKPPDLDSRSPIARVLASGKPLLVPTVSDPLLVADARDAEHLGVLRRLEMTSYIIVPLRSRRGTLGALTLVSTDPHRRFQEDDLAFAEDLARHAGLAIDNSRLYREAQQAIRAREEILGVVSHDLRNPLGTIAMTLEMIARDPEGDPGAKAVRALRSVERMKRLIGDLLDALQIEGGELSFEIAAHDAGALLADARDVVQELAERKSIEVRIAPPPAPVRVRCDRDRCQQVMLNLLGNALKFTPEGGTVEVGVRARADAAEFRVADNGPGIAPADLAHVFDRYWQSPEVRAKAEGVGLGLFISKTLIEGQGGRIWVESEPGEGATFRFTLPLAGADDAPAD